MDIASYISDIKCTKPTGTKEFLLVAYEIIRSPGYGHSVASSLWYQANVKVILKIWLMYLKKVPEVIANGLNININIIGGPQTHLTPCHRNETDMGVSIFKVGEHYKNTKRHTAHTIVSWPNHKQWVLFHTSDLMMIIRQGIYIISIITRKWVNWKHTAPHIVKWTTERICLILLTHSTKYIWQAFYKFNDFR